MVKLANIFLSICLMFVCALSITGCMNYGTSIQFETWGGTNISTKHYDYNSNINPSSFEKPNKTGYNFLGWYYDDKFDNEVVASIVALNMNVTYYAKYQLDEEYFMGLSNYYIWGNENNVLTIDKFDLWTDWYFEVDKTNGLDFNKVTVEKLGQTNFICKDVVVYDVNGKTLTDVNPNKHIFELDNGDASIGKYVVKVSTQNNGDCKVTIN